MVSPESDPVELINIDSRMQDETRPLIRLTWLAGFQTRVLKIGTRDKVLTRFRSKRQG